MTKYPIVEQTKGMPLLARMSICLKDPVYLRDTINTSIKRSIVLVICAVLGLLVHPLFFIPALFSLLILLFTVYCFMRGESYGT